MSFPKCSIRFLILDWSQVKCKAAVIKHHLINPFLWRVGLVLKTHLYQSFMRINSTGESLSGHHNLLSSLDKDSEMI